MIKTMFESKYIKLTIVIIFILAASVCFFGQSKGEEIITNEAELVTLEESGSYQLVKEDGSYTVRDKENNVIYTATSEDCKLAAKEGYIIDETPEGKDIVINFLTGEKVFNPKGDDKIVINIGDLWVLKREIPKGGGFFTEAYYFLDEKFDLALGGKAFNSLYYTEKYAYGQMLINENFYNLENLADYETFGPYPEVKQCIVNGEGEIIYESDKFIHNMKDDSIVIQDDDGKYIWLNIYTGESEAADYEDYR
ncbi:MAG: hypothetical protein IKU53_00720 [Firmicutes bacterium]|nr:hypothetical protein [Bacillota bacterium]